MIGVARQLTHKNTYLLNKFKSSIEKLSYFNFPPIMSRFLARNNSENPTMH